MLRSRILEKKGITLIALIVTIIVLLILAGVSIAMITGDSGLMIKAADSSEITGIANEKEYLSLSVVSAKLDDENGILTKENLQIHLDKTIGNNKAEVISNGNKFEVYFIESNRTYELDKTGVIEENYQKVEKDNYPGSIDIDINGNILDGSLELPYEINCIEDLVVLSNMTRGDGIKINSDGTIEEVTTINSFSGKYIILTKTLNFSSSSSYKNSERTDFGDVNNDGIVEGLLKELTTGEGFIPIGNYGVNNTKFCGNFNGNDNEIINIYINRENTAYQGLFGFVEGNINKLSVSGIIKGKAQCGGITGYLGNGKIANCKNYANIFGTHDLGGIAGYMSGNNEICDSYNSGNITGISGNDVGGIASCNYQGGKVQRCVNEGKITGKGQHVGGILGSNWSEIASCINRGNVESSMSQTGGITGYQWNGTVRNSYNSGNVVNTGTGETGGIVGWSGGSYIINSFSVGNVSNKSGNIGAVTGKNTGTVTNCSYLKNDNININKLGIAGTSDNAYRAYCYSDNIEDFYVSDFISSKMGWSAFVSEEMVTQNRLQCWIITSNFLPKLYWEK